MRSQQNKSVGAPLPVVDQDHAMSTIPSAAIDCLLESAQIIRKALEGIQKDVRPEIDRANVALADLRRRVEVLEQKQGVGETTRVAEKGQAQARKVR